MNKTITAISFISFAGALCAQTLITDNYIGQSYEYDSFKGAILNDTVSGNDYEFSGNEISGNTLTSSSQIIGGYIKTKGKVFLNDVTWSGNISKLSNDEGTTTMYMLSVDASEIEINGGQYTGNKTYINTRANGTVYGMLLNVMYGRTAKVDAATFSDNYSYSNYRVQGGALNVNGSGSSLYVSNSSLINNTVEAGNKARGAAVENYAATLDMRDSVISGNVSKSANNAYGAFYASNAGAVSNATDVMFANNSALTNGYGAAIYVEAGAVANVNVTKDALYSGNFAEANGVKEDSRGGFLYMKEGGTVNFNISENAALTIGKGIAGYDSIANQDASDSISKTGMGALTVNSSMQYFSGKLSVDGGTMNVKNGLGANSITIASGATLGLQINGDNVLSNEALALSNGGEITLAAKAGLSAGEYAVSAAGITDYGATKTYGGTLAGNIFKVGEARKMSIDVAGESIEVADNGRVELSGDNASITMAFNADLATVNSVKTTTESLQEAIGTNFAAMGAYGFDVAMDSEDTVVLSFLIRDSSLKAADFTVYHKSEGGVWTAADDIENLVYDGEYLSFVVSHFSEYGYAAVPEPSVCAAIFGALALAFAVFRRRK